MSSIPERLGQPAQNLRRPSLVIEESALEKVAAGQVTEGPFILHSDPSFDKLSERARRPSIVRNDSDLVSVVKDGAYEPSVTTVQVEDVVPQAHAIAYLSPTSGTTDPVTRQRQFQTVRLIHMIAACWCFFVEGDSRSGFSSSKGL